jgi:hypothetical protein
MVMPVDGCQWSVEKAVQSVNSFKWQKVSYII